MPVLIIEYTAIDSVELENLAREEAVKRHGHGETLEDAITDYAAQGSVLTEFLILDDRVAPIEWTPALEAEAKLQGESPEAGDAAIVVDDGDSPDEPTELE